MSKTQLRLLRACLLPAVLAVAVPGRAVEIVPFFTRNQSPFVQIFGLPPAEPGILTPSGKWSVQLVLDVANNFIRDSRTDESVRLDGETYRTTLALRYGFRSRLEFGADVAFVGHYGGIFDGFIEGWHDTLGLPQQGRDRTKNGLLTYRYVRDGALSVNVDDSNTGLGDVRLSGAIRICGGESLHDRSLVLRAGLKVPTGSSSRLRGSGSTDLSLALAASDPKTLAGGKMTLFGAAGLLWMTDGDVLEDRQRNVAGFGTAGIGWSPWEPLGLKAQLNWHTAFYRSALDAVGSASAQGVFGGTLRLPGHILLDLAVAEDIVVDTSPDVVFHLGLQKRF